MIKAKSNEPIRVGVLFSETGVTSVTEESEQMGTLLAIHEINDADGINSRELQAVSYDSGTRPSKVAALAGKLILEDRVHGILGCYMSSTRKAVIPWWSDGMPC